MLNRRERSGKAELGIKARKISWSSYKEEGGWAARYARGVGEQAGVTGLVRCCLLNLKASVNINQCLFAAWCRWPCHLCLLALPTIPVCTQKLGENYFCPDVFALFSLGKRQVFQKSVSVNKPSEYSWVCFEDGMVNRDKNTNSKPGTFRRMSLLETGILHVILIYSQLTDI